MNRREFLRQTYCIGGLAALYSLGLSSKKIEAQMSPIFMGADVAPVGGCSTIEQSGGTTNSALSLDGDPTRYAHSFTASSSYTLCSVVFSLWKTGTPPDTTIEIWSDNSGAPNVKVADIGTISAAELSTSSADETFSSLSISLTNATRYWYVFINDTADGSNTFRIDRTTSGPEILYQYSGSWSLVDSSSTLTFDNYK